MKKIISFFPITFLIFLFVVYFSGCSDSITNPSVTTASKYQAHTEAEFNANSSLKAIPGAVVYDDLEHINTPASLLGDDTGPIGEDVISYYYSDSATHRFRLGAEADFKVRMIASSGLLMFQLYNPGDTARVFIPAGNYKLYLTSNVTYTAGSAASQPVFIQRDADAVSSASGAPPSGNYSKDDLNTLITTKKCDKCNLEQIQLSGNDLTGAEITNSNMHKAFFDRVNLTGATLKNVEWTDGGGNNCNFAGAKIINTFLYRSSFDHGYFVNSTFQHILWDHSHFTSGDFRNATLDSGTAYNGSIDGSNFNYAKISNLDWHEMSSEAVTFISSTFSKVSCYTMYFPNVTMDSAKFINKCFFQLTQFRDSRIRYASFDDFRGDGSLFDNNDLRGTRITNAYFGGGSFRAAILINAVWNDVQIPAVNMCHQDRTGASFTNVRGNVDTDCWP